MDWLDFAFTVIKFVVGSFAFWMAFRGHERGEFLEASMWAVAAIGVSSS